MERINRHTINENVIKSTNRSLKKVINWLFEDINVLKQNPYRKSLGAIFNDTYKEIAESQTLGHPRNEVFTFLYYAHQLGIAMFKLAANPGKDVVVRFGDTDVSAIGKETRDYVHPAYWIKVYRLAIILRDNKTYKFLQSIDNTVLLKTNVTTDSFDIAFVNFLKNIKNHNYNIRDKYLYEALKHVDNPNFVNTSFVATSDIEKSIDKDRLHLIQAIFKPVLLIYQKIFSSDNEGMNDLIVSYLNNYKNFVINNKYQSNAGFWLARDLLAALAFAHDQGMRIDVESDYIPAWLYKGEFEGLKQQLVC